MRPLKHIKEFTEPKGVLEEAEEHEVDIATDIFSIGKTTRALLWSSTLGRPITWQEVDELWGDKWTFMNECELTLLYLRRNPPVYPGAVDLIASILFNIHDIHDDPTIMTPIEAAVLMQAANVRLVLVTESND